jgi:hypothetical protein
MRLQVFKFLFLIAFPLLFLACPFGENGNSSFEYKQVETQDDADSVAMIIEHQADEPISVYDDTTWDSEQIEGNYSGYATVSGSYSESDGAYYDTSYYTYDNVTIDFNNFQTDSDYPSITGSATLTGTLSVDSSYTYGNDYGGSWTFSGTVTLDPSTVDEDEEYGYFYEGTVEFYFVYGTKYEYAGTITVDGQSWDVDNYY